MVFVRRQLWGSAGVSRDRKTSQLLLFLQGNGVLNEVLNKSVTFQTVYEWRARSPNLKLFMLTIKINYIVEEK